MGIPKLHIRNPINDIRESINNGRDVNFHIMAIIAIAGAVANTIGFLANLILYGMNIPTAICAGCDLCAIIYLCFGLTPRRYMFSGSLLLFLIVVIEFPMLIFTYGPVMYPYMILGIVAVAMMTAGKKRLIGSIFLGVYDVAVIILSTFFGEIFGENDPIGLLGSAAVTFAVTIATVSVMVGKWQETYVKRARDMDSLTGVLSRSGFISSATRYLKGVSAGSCYVLFFDIKSFKAVNSVYGISGGNEVLAQIADRLRGSALKPVLLGRQGGDHFVCLVKKEHLDLEVVGHLCRYKYTEKGKSMVLTLNCGIYPVNDLTVSVPSMCDRAEAVTRQIHRGQNRYYGIYDETAEKDFSDQTHILGEVEQAIHDKEFEPYYQPIVDAKTHRIVSAEALARWNHRDRGFISPSEFIPVLEKKELISDLDAIIARKVSRFIESRAAQNRPVVPVSINLSRVDLYDSELIEELQTMVKSSRLKENGYRFEVTESAYESLSESVIGTLSDFRKIGAQIMVDDFGSGYSSLGMITDYEFDVLKFDMKFASRIDTNEKVKGVIQSLIRLSHNLDAKVVAEGVETESQLRFLTESGCDYIQGYLFYKPMPEKEFSKLLEAQDRCVTE